MPTRSSCRSATLLNGLGIAMIYRIDLADEDLAGWDAVSMRQLAWTAIAILVAIAVVLVLRNHRVLFRYTYLIAMSRGTRAAAPADASSDRSRDRTAPASGSSFGAFSFQPGELAKIALAIFFAGYLVRTRDSLSDGG